MEKFKTLLNTSWSDSTKKKETMLITHNNNKLGHGWLAILASLPLKS